MPELRSYVVRETRELHISANNVTEAVKQASFYLEMGTTGGYENIPLIRTINITATEE